MLKVLWLLAGSAALVGGLLLQAREGAWRKQQLVHRFGAYLQTSGGYRHPITSDQTVVGCSRRSADLVLTIPGARTKGQKAALRNVAPCHPEILHQQGRFSLRNLQPQRRLSLLRAGSGFLLSLAPGEEAPLVHGDEIRVAKECSLYFYQGEVS